MQFECNTMLQNSNIYIFYFAYSKGQVGRVVGEYWYSDPLFIHAWHSLSFDLLFQKLINIYKTLITIPGKTRHTHRKLNMKTRANTILSYNWLEQGDRLKFPFQMFEHLSNTISLVIPKTQGLGQDWAHETKDTNLQIELIQ